MVFWTAGRFPSVVVASMTGSSAGNESYAAMVLIGVVALTILGLFMLQRERVEYWLSGLPLDLFGTATKA